MINLALLLAVCLSGANPTPELKPDRFIDTWEITNSGADQETFTLKSDGTFVHTCRDGKKVTKQLGHWEVASKKLLLTTKQTVKPAEVPVLLAKRPEEDALAFGRDTLAYRQSLVAEQRLAMQLFPTLRGECLEYKEPSGSAYRIFFRNIWPSALFDIVLWPRSRKDADRLEKLAFADLRQRGFSLKHRVEIDRRGY